MGSAPAQLLNDLVQPLEERRPVTLVERSRASRDLAGLAQTRHQLPCRDRLSDRVLREEPPSRAQHAHAYFEALWGNEPGRRFSVGYDAYSDESLRKKFQYELEERSGLSTF